MGLEGCERWCVPALDVGLGPSDSLQGSQRGKDVGFRHLQEAGGERPGRAPRRRVSFRLHGRDSWREALAFNGHWTKATSKAGIVPASVELGRRSTARRVAV